MTDKRAVTTFAFKHLLDHSRDPGSHIISDGILKKGALMVIGGPPKAYKSFVTTSIAICLATGRNLFGTTRTRHGRHSQAFTIVSPQRILMFEQEIGEDDLEDRIRPFYSSLPPDAQQLLRENLFTHSLDRTLRFDSAQSCASTEAIIRTVKPNIVIFDPLIEFHDQEENSPSAMAGVLKNLMLMCDRCHVTPILCHHEGKEGDSPRAGGDRLRGASSIYGKGDTFISLRVVNRNACKIQVEFTLRRGKPIPDLLLKIDPETLEAKFLCWRGDKNWKRLASPADDSVTNLDDMDTPSGTQ